MPNIENYFSNDFVNYINIDDTIEIKILDKSDGFIRIKRKAVQERISDARTLIFLIPNSNFTFEAIEFILNSYENHIIDFNSAVSSSFFFKDLTLGNIENYENLYSKHIFIYYETELSKNQITILNQFCNQKKIRMTLRGTNYLKNKMEIEKPVAFISHDSRDKDLIARHIYKGLTNRLTTVWFDEFSLNPGDSLRESIEKGIKEAKKCILLITPNFISNHGWTKIEFDSVFTREIILKENILIPIWYNVSPKDVYEFSPSLADRVALIWPTLTEGKENEYNIKIEELITKIHYNISK